MKSNKTRKHRVQSVARWFLCLSSIGLCGIWLLVTNLGCISEEAIFSDLWSFRVELEPEKFQIEPEKTYSSTASLLWSDEQRKVASNWSVGTDNMGVLESVSCSPTTKALTTTVTANSGSYEALYGAKGIWTTANSLSTRLPVKASFIDPVWASLAEQNVTRWRQAFLLFEFNSPRLTVEVTTIQPRYENEILRGLNFKGNARVLGAPPGWRYAFQLKNISNDSALFPDLVVTPSADGQSVTFEQSKPLIPGTGSLTFWREFVRVKATPTQGQDFFLEKEHIFQVMAYRSGS